ncbi:MAG: energy transducer TonB [Polyangiaceae bacterium]
MSTQYPVQDLDILVSDLFDAPFKSRAWSAFGWLAALGLHVFAFSTMLDHRAAQAEKERSPVEVELVAPPPPPAPPEPLPERETPPEPQAAPRMAPARAAAAPPPAPAQAGALHTAKDDPSAQAQPEPLDFTHDPNVAGFGAGVVAVGGTAAFGVKNAAPAPRQAEQGVAPAAKTSGESLTAAADLGRKPSLGESDPCRGYFPQAASDDVANASVMVTLNKSGSVSKVTLLNETPSGQGFGAAARACMQSKHFTPALDREGRPTATAIRVNVRFSR